MVTARLLHDASRRKHHPFLAVSCALFSDTLIESELFGHERGAFTGAVRERPGRFELADGGTGLGTGARCTKSFSSNSACG